MKSLIKGSSSAMKSPHVQVLRSLLDDIQRFLPCVEGLQRDLVTLEARFEHEGLGFLSDALCTLGKALDQGLSTGTFTCPPGFARKMKIPKLLSGVFCKVFDPTTGKLLEECTLEVSLLRQFLFFWRKYPTTPEREAILAKKAVGTFTSCDNEVQELAPFRREHLTRVASLVLPTLDLWEFLPGKHGPGAVVEGCNSNQKWVEWLPYLVDLDTRLESIGYDLPYGLIADDNLVPSVDNTKLSEVAKLVTVPKTYSSLRTITVEPLINQFVQQALNSHLRKEIRRCRVLKNSLTLTDQGPNQQLALLGSLNGDWVTIDLSSASDRLSTHLVESCFANRPRYLSAIMGCRTREVEAGETRLSLKKYAGQGNATTFPVQSVCYALICLASMTKVGERLTLRKLAALARRVRVYGDDIIVKREHYQGVATWLEECGMKINHNKTFSLGRFRESCGIDAFRGTTVTPVYMRFEPDNISTDASSLASAVSCSNQLWMGGMYSTADCIKGFVDRVVTLPLVPQNSSGLGYHTRKDVATYHRWSRSLHRWETLTYVQVPLRRPDVLSGVPALMKYFHSPSSGEFDTKHLESSVRRFTSKLRKRWVPAR